MIKIMIRHNTLYFLTIVLMPAFLFGSQTPVDKILDDNKAITGRKIEEIKESEESKLLNDKGLKVTQPLEKKENLTPQHEFPFFYEYALGGRLGVSVDQEDDGFSFPILFGFFYRFPFLEKFPTEISVDLLSNSKGVLDVSYLYYLAKRNLRLYGKAGLSVFLIAEDKLATLSNLDNYGANLAVGMEDILYPPLSFKVELGARVGLEQVTGYFIFGYSWSW